MPYGPGDLFRYPPKIYPFLNQTLGRWHYDHLVITDRQKDLIITSGDKFGSQLEALSEE